MSKLNKYRNENYVGDFRGDLSQEQVERYNRYKKQAQGTVENASNYLNIWKRSPSFNDVNSDLAAVKVGCVGLLLGAVMFLSYMVFKNLVLSIMAAITCAVLFLLSFHDQLFCLKNFLSLKLRSASRIDPFEDLRFWMIGSKRDVLLYENVKDKMTVGVKIFRVKVVAENVEPNYLSFLKGLANNDIPFTYQVIQQPLVGSTSSKNSPLMNMNESIESLRTVIYFCTFHDIKGTNKREIGYLLDVLDMFAASLESGFKSNYRHHEIKLLKGNRLINGFRVMFTRSVPENEETARKQPNRPSHAIHSAVKSSFLVMTSLYLFLLLERLGVISFLAIAFLIGFTIAFTWLFWRELLFAFSRASRFRDSGIIHVQPFEGVEWYHYRRAPECLFTLVDKKLLIGTKIFNHNYIIPPFLDTRGLPIAKITKFMEAIVPARIPVSFTCQMAPVRFSTLHEKGWNCLLERIQDQMVQHDDALSQETFMKYRYGIFRTIITMGIHEVLPVKKYSLKHASRVEWALRESEMKVMASFAMNMDTHKGMMLGGTRLISGYLFESLKSKFFRVNGSHLGYLFIQGAYLARLIEIFPDFKKGLKSKIAAEFNAPLSLENVITIGHSINTEFHSKEIKAGFRKNQAGNVLITGGSLDSREMVMMKLALELVRARVPCIAFDFSGEWSRLLSYFKGSMHDEAIDYFALGSSFTLDPFTSGIPYDQNNADYLNYMFESLSLVFQKDEHEMEAFKAQVRNAANSLNSDGTMSMMKEDVVNAQPWEKKGGEDAFVNFFDQFPSKDMGSLSLSGEESESITVKEFVDTDATIIIDLSSLKDLRKKVFSTLVIIAKIIHHVESEKPYHEKILFFPQVDAAFNAQFIKRTGNHGKIDAFIEPLKKMGFGLVAVTESISHVHPHVYPYFRNYIALKTTEREDISRIEKLMNFRALHGRGIYGKERNEAFQLEYLTTMKPWEMIIKRSDVEQPFPLKLDAKVLAMTPVMKKNEIVEFMRGHGHDMERSEQNIIDKAKKSLFRKNFDYYFAFIEEIIEFMEAMKTIQGVSGNYKNTLKEELLKFITPRAIKILGTGKKKSKVITFRNDIFNILLKHDYLVENHPLHASGSESIRTSYCVGPQYEKALAEHRAEKNQENEPYHYELVSRGDSVGDKGGKDIISNNGSEESRDAVELRTILASELGAMFDTLFRVHLALKNGRVHDARKLERDILKELFERIYCRLNGNGMEDLPAEKQLELLTACLTSMEGFPVTEEALLTLMDECAKINHSIDNPEQDTRTLYHKLDAFFSALSTRLSGKGR